MATKKTKTTAGTVIDGTTATNSVADVVEKAVETISNEGSSGALAGEPDLKAGATVSQDPAAATGEEQPGGTNTQGDDAGANVPTPVEPQNPEPALTVNEAAATPEAAAPASGILSADEQFVIDGMTSNGFEHDGVVLSREDVAKLFATALRDAIEARKPVSTEVRHFELLKPVILHNKIVDAEIVRLTQVEHAKLAAQAAVFPDWDSDALEVDA